MMIILLGALTVIHWAIHCQLLLLKLICLPDLITNSSCWISYISSFNMRSSNFFKLFILPCNCNFCKRPYFYCLTSDNMWVEFHDFIVLTLWCHYWGFIIIIKYNIINLVFIFWLAKYFTFSPNVSLCLDNNCIVYVHIS